MRNGAKWTRSCLSGVPNADWPTTKTSSTKSCHPSSMANDSRISGIDPSLSSSRRWLSQRQLFTQTPARSGPSDHRPVLESMMAESPFLHALAASSAAAGLWRVSSFIPNESFGETSRPTPPKRQRSHQLGHLSSIDRRTSWPYAEPRRVMMGPHNSAQEATSEDRGLRRQLRSRLSAPNRWADQT